VNKIRPPVIVTTVVKDEGWMMPAFLENASSYSDHIIVFDESTGLDDTRSYYKRYPKVIPFFNDGEPIRYDIKRNFTFNKARELFPGPKLIVPLDGDEILSANLKDSDEWDQVLSSQPGTLIHLQWVNLWHEHTRYKVDCPGQYGNYNRTLWMDDDTSQIPDVGEKGFHMVYTPLTAQKEIWLKDIVCLHYQFCNWNRMESKHRYYRAHEKAHIRKLSDLAIWRIYGHFQSTEAPINESERKWFADINDYSIEEKAKSSFQITYYDLLVLDYIREFGVELFEYQDIWRAPWPEIVRVAKNLKKIPEDFEFRFPSKKIQKKLWELYLRETIDLDLIRNVERKVFRKGFNYNPRPLSKVLWEKFEKLKALKSPL